MVMASPRQVAVRSADTAYVHILAAGFETGIDAGGITFDKTLTDVTLAQHAVSKDVIEVKTTGAAELADGVHNIVATFSINGMQHTVGFAVSLLGDSIIDPPNPPNPPGPDPDPTPTPPPPVPTPEPDPVIVPPVNNPELGPNGELDITIPVTDTDGNTLTVVEITETENNAAALNALLDMGLFADVVNSALSISGTAVDIGTVTLEVAARNAQGVLETTTVTVLITPILRHTDTKVDDEPGTWTGELTVAEDENGARTYTFVLYVPVEITQADAQRAQDVDATLNGGTLSNAAFTPARTDIARGADAQYIQVTGTTSDPDGVYVSEITYRLGVHKYIQAMQVKLSDTDITDKTGGGAGGGSSGCAAGTGVMALLSLLLLWKRKD